jgi:hypothetical protein
LFEYLAIGIDVQPRGLAIAHLDFDTMTLQNAEWHPLLQDGTIENSVYVAWIEATKAISKSDAIMITIEFPTAKASSQFMPLWCMCGAVIAAARENCNMVEGITPNSWKMYSGLNSWAKAAGVAKRGIIQKKDIPMGVYATCDGAISGLEPVDLYDSIAIGKAGIARNTERFK